MKDADMDLTDLQRALIDRAAEAPPFAADPELLVRQGDARRRRRRVATTTVAVLVVAGALVGGLTAGGAFSSSDQATLVPAASPTASPSVEAAYCSPPNIAACEAAHPAATKSDVAGTAKQLYGLPIRIPITHLGKYSYSIPVSGIRKGFNSFAIGFNIEPKAGTQVTNFHGFPSDTAKDAAGNPSALSITFTVDALTGDSAVVLRNVQVENIGCPAPNPVC
jgi:hypothetical protein